MEQGREEYFVNHKGVGMGRVGLSNLFRMDHSLGQAAQGGLGIETGDEWVWGLAGGGDGGWLGVLTPVTQSGPQSGAELRCGC